MVDLGRREAVLRVARAAGVAPVVMSLLAGKVSALGRSEETDLAILSAALTLEHHAIALYRHGLHEGLVPVGLRLYAVEFVGDHEGHRDTQVSIAEERGGRAPEPLASYDFTGVGPGDDFLREALEIEQVAQDTYLGIISQIRSEDYRLTAGFVLIDEVRHLTIWRRALSLPIY